MSKFLNSIALLVFLSCNSVQSIRAADQNFCGCPEQPENQILKLVITGQGLVTSSQIMNNRKVSKYLNEISLLGSQSHFFYKNGQFEDPIADIIREDGRIEIRPKPGVVAFCASADVKVGIEIDTVRPDRRHMKGRRRFEWISFLAEAAVTCRYVLNFYSEDSCDATGKPLLNLVGSTSVTVSSSRDDGGNEIKLDVTAVKTRVDGVKVKQKVEVTYPTFAKCSIDPNIEYSVISRPGESKKDWLARSQKARACLQTPDRRVVEVVEE